MPTVIPTPDEIARMSWRQREGARLRANAALQALREAELDAVASLDHLWDATREAAEWALAVRAEARRLLDATEPDPNAATHRQILREAISK